MSIWKNCRLTDVDKSKTNQGGAPKFRAYVSILHKFENTSMENCTVPYDMEYGCVRVCAVCGIFKSISTQATHSFIIIIIAKQTSILNLVDFENRCLFPVEMLSCYKILFLLHAWHHVEGR